MEVPKIKTALVTGGAGFIGSHLCDALVNRNINVMAVDNFSNGSINNINHLKNNKLFSLYKFDINNQNKLDNLLSCKSIDTVFHMAANSDIIKSCNNPLIDFNNTFLSTFSILQSMNKNNINQIVFASTSAIFGELGSNISENSSPMEPLSHYGAAKLASEAFISSYNENYGLQSWIIRFPQVVGERATHGVIYDFINKLKANPLELDVLGNGEQEKPYVYIDDIINGILFIWDTSNEKNNVFNIGTDSQTQVKNIANMIIKEMGLNAKINYTKSNRGWIGDVPKYKFDLTKIHKLGWEVQRSSDDAVLKAIRSILQN